MTTKTILGLVLLAAGAILLIYGFDASDSLASEVSEAVDGTPSDKSMWMIGGGAVAAIAGLGAMLTKRRG